jgi:hypothetical protein
MEHYTSFLALGITSSTFFSFLGSPGALHAADIQVGTPSFGSTTNCNKK